LTDPGFDFTLLHDFRDRLLTHEAAQRLLDTFLTARKARGGIKARGTQRTDSTHVLAAVRTLRRFACALGAMRHALNQLSETAPTWVQQHVPLEWYARSGLRAEQTRLPKDASTREALARQIGADGYQLLDWMAAPESPPGLRDLPALEALRRIWLQHYDRGTVPGLEALRWRTGDEHPPSALPIHSPYDLEARYGSTRDTHWVGYTLHLTEACDPAQPDLITKVITTPATTPDGVMGPSIVHDLAARDLLPGTHVLDSGDVDADFLVTAQRQHHIDVVGPAFGSYSRQHQTGQGDDVQAFVLNWEARQGRCPQGQTSVHWRPGRDVSGDPVIRIRFDGATCRACPARPACTTAKGAPRQLTVRPQVHHEAIQAARPFCPAGTLPLVTPDSALLKDDLPNRACSDAVCPRFWRYGTLSWLPHQRSAPPAPTAIVARASRAIPVLGLHVANTGAASINPRDDPIPESISLRL
jgi:DDE family transposase